MKGSSDTETFFFLALTFGLEDDSAARRGARGRLHRTGLPTPRIAHPVQNERPRSRNGVDVGLPLRSQGQPPSLYFSTKVSTLREQHPDIPVFQALSDNSRLVVSEPLGDLEGALDELPASSYGVVKLGPAIGSPSTANLSRPQARAFVRSAHNVCNG